MKNFKLILYRLYDCLIILISVWVEKCKVQDGECKKIYSFGGR